MNDLRSLVPPSSPSSERGPLKIGDNVLLLKGLSSDKPAIVAFLRHIGCPFAEKTFLDLRAFADKHGESYQYIAITHGNQTDTDDWVKEVGGPGRIMVVSDPDREIYGQWGVGRSGWLHWIGWSSLTSVWALAKEEGIKNRVTRGNRWVSAGTFGVRDGNIVSVQLPNHAGELPNFEEIRRAVDVKGTRESRL